MTDVRPLNSNGKIWSAAILMEKRMETRSGSRMVVWLVVIVAVLVLIPLVGMIGMMAMGGMMGGTTMSGQMGGGMMGMHGWGLLWMVLVAVVVIALIILVVRGISKT